MGVELANTMHYRAQNDLMNSESLKFPMEDPMNVDGNESWDPLGHKKQAASVLSQASSSVSQRPSSPKVLRTGQEGQIY